MYRGREFLEFHKTKRAALASMRDSNKQARTAKGTPEKPVVHFRGVQARYNSLREEWTFDARAKDPKTGKQQFLGTAPNERQAATKISELLGTTVKDIALHKTSQFQNSPEIGIERFKMLLGLFKGWVPADIATAVDFRSKAPLMAASAPGIYIAALLGKEGRWKQCVLEAWELTPVQQRHKVAGIESMDKNLCAAAGKIMHDILSRSMVAWSGQGLTTEEKAEARKYHDFWNLHVNRNVCHHHSLIPFAFNFGLIEKAREKARRNTVVMSNKEGTGYSLVSYSAAKHTHLMCKLQKLGRSTQCVRVPTTSTQWLASFKDAMDCAKRLKLPGEGYHWEWLTRTVLLAEMRNSKVKGLTLDIDWGVDEVVAAMLPDQSEWIPLWMQKCTRDSLRQLLRKLNYCEPLEMLSCLACVLNDSSLTSVPIEKLERNSALIMKCRRAVIQEYGFEGHPTLIIKQALAQASNG